MPNLTISSTLANEGTRERQFSCDLKITNDGTGGVELHSVTPRIPDGVDIQEIHDTSVAESRREHEKLCNEVALLLDEYNMKASKEYRDRVFSFVRKEWRQQISIKSGADLYLKLFTGQLEDYQRQRLAKFASFALSLHSAEEATEATDRFLDKSSDEGKFLADFIDLKIRRIQQLEQKDSAITGGTVLTTLAPTESFSRTYVFTCHRGVINPLSYTLSFDCSSGDPTSDDTRNQTSSVSVTVSPSPIVLTGVALGSAIMGVALKEAVAPIPDGVEYVEYWRQILVTSPHKFVAATVSALVFFNIYEYTEIGKKFRQGVSWRSALLIGTLCGLLNERIVGAITGLISG